MSPELQQEYIEEAKRLRNQHIEENRFYGCTPKQKNYFLEGAKIFNQGFFGDIDFSTMVFVVAAYFNTRFNIFILYIFNIMIVTSGSTSFPRDNDEGILLSALPKDTSSELSGLFSTLSLCAKRQAVNTIL